MDIDISDEKGWLERLQNDDESVLQLLFDRYYKYLVVTSYKVVHDDHQARDIVQDVFFDVWKKRANMKIEGNIKPYLRRAVVNRSIDFLRKKKRLVYSDEVVEFEQPTNLTGAQELLEASDLESVIHATIAALPERCRVIFSLSRFEELSHKEIAAKLDISTKTIENQMTKALRTIRAAVDKYGLIFALGIGCFASLKYLLEHFFN